MLEAGGHVQHVLDLCSKIEQNPDGPINALKVVIDTKLKLINKFLPDMKSVEVTGQDGEELVPREIRIKFIGRSDVQ
jgi:hypothetical protein